MSHILSQACIPIRSTSQLRKVMILPQMLLQKPVLANLLSPQEQPTVAPKKESVTCAPAASCAAPNFDRHVTVRGIRERHALCSRKSGNTRHVTDGQSHGEQKLKPASHGMLLRKSTTTSSQWGNGVRSRGGNMCLGKCCPRPRTTLTKTPKTSQCFCGMGIAC